MRSLVARAPASFTLAAAIGATCAVAAIAILASTPAPPASDELRFFWRFDAIGSQALSAAGMVVLAVWLRSRQEAASYAFLAGAALVAGWAVDALWSNSVEAGSPSFGLRLLSLLFTVAAPTAVIALFASTPRRRLSRWTPAALGALVVGAIAGAGLQTWLELDGWTGETFNVGYFPLVGDIPYWFTSPFPVLAAFAAAAIGSLRYDALRFTPGAAVAHRDRGVEPRLRVALVVALGVGAAMAYAWLVEPVPSAYEDMLLRGESARLLLLPLLTALVGVVAARWSVAVAWAALAISLGLSSAAILTDALEVAVGQIIEAPEAPWTPNGQWLVQVGTGWLIVIVAIAFASSALGATRAAMPGQPPRTTPGALHLTLVTLGLTVWALYLWTGGFWSTQYPWFETPIRGAIMAGFCLSWLLIITAAEAARGRLVPAVAEAEIVARRPLRPFRYLETVVVEALTGRSALRRIATAAERTRLASDLHAELLPSIAEIAAEYEAGAPQADVAQRLRRLESEIRDLMAERRLVVLEEFGIVEAIEWLLGRAEERASLDVELSVSDRTTPERPPREVERAAFRIAQLAVENALQHASPSRLALDVLARPDEVRISISDDGRGLTDAPADRTRDHTGIADMRVQAADVRGDVQVVEPATGGTTVTFAWPAISST